MTWSLDDIPDLSGKRVLLTGVTGGLGFETALELGRRGAELVVTARNHDKGVEYGRLLYDGTGSRAITMVPLDLASLSSVHRRAAQIRQEFPRIDILINNAGIMATPERQSLDGFELQMATNHLGHFAWTALLWPTLSASNARVVTVSSLMHAQAKGVDLRVLNKDPSPRRYRRWRAYAESKLANLMFALELNRRIQAAHLEAVSVAAHPGYASTNLTQTGASMGGSLLWSSGMHRVSRVFGQSAQAGAMPVLMAATMPRLAGGSYVGPSRFNQMRGEPQLVGMTKAARDVEAAERLWAQSETATGVRFSVTGQDASAT